ncbi:MAG: thermonuclease family protein [Nitrospirae bacterium]|nr:thermonuclease family protein [Nitrospirota bacterium]
MDRTVGSLGFAVLAGFFIPACGGAKLDASCGPPQGIVQSVIDGDTIRLESGETVRYLLVDAPEIGAKSQACFGPEARELNVQLVENRTVDLSYDKECRDKYGRLLAYVTLKRRSINALLIKRGFGCVMQIPPNGESRKVEFLTLQEKARASKRGLWGGCPRTLCPDS